jgi:poly(A) polymerase
MIKTELFRTIAERFEGSGYQFLEVGGSVRDSIMGREPSDYDFCTDATPGVIKLLLHDLGDIYTVGEEFGTIGLMHEGLKLEITTFRAEIYPQDSRKPKVEFGYSLMEDLRRRDFTINSIARRPINGAIYDYFGGIQDIQERLIRLVGGTQRFEEDPLRMMRAIRFASQLGFGFQDIKMEHPERLEIISSERIHDELVKILESPNPSFGVRNLCAFGLMQYIIPEIEQLLLINQGRHHIKDAFQHTMDVLERSVAIDFGESNLKFRLACLLHDIAKPVTRTEDDNDVHFYGHQDVGAEMAKDRLQALRFDTDTIEAVYTLIKFHMYPILLEKEKSLKRAVIRRMIRKIGPDYVRMLLSLVRCDLYSSASPRQEFVSRLEKVVEGCLTEHPEMIVSPLTGDEIMERFGLVPGKRIGELKDYLLGLVLDGKLDPEDKETAERILREEFDFLHD